MKVRKSIRKPYISEYMHSTYSKDIEHLQKLTKKYTKLQIK